MMQTFRCKNFMLYAIVLETLISEMSLYSFTMPVWFNMFFISVVSIFVTSVWLLKNDFKVSQALLYFPLAIIILLLFQVLLRGSDTLDVLGFLSTATLILVLGVLIPTIYKINDFISTLRKILFFVGVISILLSLFGSGNIYEGGRFSGMFTSSVHMTQVALFGFIIFSIYALEKKSKAYILMTIVYLYLIVITGSRSSFLISLSAIALYYVVGYKSTLKPVIIFAFIILSPITFFAVEGLVTGKIGLGDREEVTNPISDRVLHWGYGIEKLNESPVLGYGTLSKYKNNGIISLDNFSEQNDPHNMFVYSGQVGGYPLIVIMIFFYLFLIKKSLQGVKSDVIFFRISSVVIIMYLALFVVGGSLFSIGSLMDRFFWIFAGYVVSVNLLPIKFKKARVL